MRTADRRTLIPVLALCAALFLPWLGARDLWAPDEPRYAQVAQEMLRDGHWWQPYVNGEPYRDKPPLVFWAAAAASLPVGHVTEWSARVPAVLAAFLTILLTWDLGRRTGGRGAALVASTVLATTWLVVWMARRLNLDLPLTAFATLAVWCGWRAGEAERRGRAALWSLGAGAAAALGMMTKGPVVLLPVLAPLVVLAAHPLRRAGRERGDLPRAIAWGVLGCVVPLLAWLLPAHLVGGYDVVGIVMQHVVRRAAHGLHHVREPWYYLETFPADFMPWTLLALPAAWAAWRRGVRRSPVDGALLGWAVIPIVLLSIIVEKRNLYLLPLFPAWALLIGRWAAVVPDDAPPRAFRIGLGTVAVASWLLGIAAAAAAAVAPHVDAARPYLVVPGVRPALWRLAVLAGAGAVGMAVVAARRRGPIAERVALHAAAFAVTFAGVFSFLPALDPWKSAREVGDAIRSSCAEAPLAVYPLVNAGGFAFYSGRSLEVLETPEDLRRWVEASPRPACVVVYANHAGELPPDGDAPPHAIVGPSPERRDALLFRYDPR